MATRRPAEMLSQAAEDLQREGVALLIARDIGEVRDVLRRTDADRDLQRVYPTVQAAVDAAERALRLPTRDRSG